MFIQRIVATLGLRLYTTQTILMSTDWKTVSDSMLQIKIVKQFPTIRHKIIT